jgi:hypothetical protein
VNKPMTTERAAEIVFVGGPERNLTVQQVIEYAERNPGERHFLENAPAYKVARHIRAEVQKDAA